MKSVYSFAAAATLALFAMAPAAQAQNAPHAGEGAYCLKLANSATNCTFTTAAACEKQRKSQGGSCMKNPKMAANPAHPKAPAAHTK